MLLTLLADVSGCIPACISAALFLGTSRSFLERWAQLARQECIEVGKDIESRPPDKSNPDADTAKKDYMAEHNNTGLASESFRNMEAHERLDVAVENENNEERELARLVTEASMLKADAERRATAAEEARINAERQANAKLAEERLLKIDAEERAKAAEERAKVAEEARINIEKQANAKLADWHKASAIERAKSAEEARINAEKQAKARHQEEAVVSVKLPVEPRMKSNAEERAKAVEEGRSKAEREADAKIAEESRAKASAEERARAAEEALRNTERQLNAKIAEESKLKAKAEERANLAEEARILTERQLNSKLEEEARLKAQAEHRAKAAEEARLNFEREVNAKLAEETRLKIKAEERAKVAESNLNALPRSQSSTPPIRGLPDSFRRVAGNSAQTRLDSTSSIGSFDSDPRIEPVTTLIFVDIDGVLNVGVQDPGKNNMMLNQKNVEMAPMVLKSRDQKPEIIECAERLVAVCDREVPDEGGATYKHYVASTRSGLSDALVKRLAELIRVAGKETQVVLSSSWRFDETRLKIVEEALSRHLGMPFTFGAKTALIQELVESDRLRNIGNFISGFISTYCGSHFHEQLKLKVLVLDDFPIGRWYLDGMAIDSQQTVERYLLQRAPKSLDIRVKFSHTYDSWQTPHGVIHVGSGITMKHFHQARDFLAGQKPGQHVIRPSVVL